MFCSLPVGLMWLKFNKICSVTVLKSHSYTSVDHLRRSCACHQPADFKKHLEEVCTIFTGILKNLLIAYDNKR